MGDQHYVRCVRHPVSEQTQAAIDRLAGSTGYRSEATIQSDVRLVLLDPALGLVDRGDEVDLEAHVGGLNRIDVEVGSTVIEVKTSLESDTKLSSAKAQLAGYVKQRTVERGGRYVGVLTDGRLFIALHEVDGDLVEATRHRTVGGPLGADALLTWLEGVLATKEGLRPTPNEIADRLGADSSSHALDIASLTALYGAHSDLPTVQLKRALWANLLRSALGTQFRDEDELFLEHTLLVNSADVIAHLVLGLDVTQLSPATVLSGAQFSAHGLYGVVDRDFFDWVVEVPGGDGYIRELARRLSRFDWSSVEHDVLKVLYESVIPAATRKALGEYYTPDWLAHQIVEKVVTDPLNQRVADVSCGSGSFLFYAVRRFLDAAHAAGWPLSKAMHKVSSQVVGVDLHPVAVALARVTYLLALGRERLTLPDRGVLSVPVYLGDSLGWDQRSDLFSAHALVVPTEEGDQLFSSELRFPEHLLTDAARFDDLVEALVTEAGRAAGTDTGRLSAGTVRRLALDEADMRALDANFTRLRQLHEAGRDHIWSYYIRNVARPAWLAREENRVDVLVGNPPWLSYRHMSQHMQEEFRRMSKQRNLWEGDNATITHQDLAGLFIARAIERYLKIGGKFGYVVPNPVVDRDYWAGFRRAQFEEANVAFETSWDLRRLRPHLFPRGSAVAFGARAHHALQMPLDIEVWSGRAPSPHAPAGGPLTSITRSAGKAVIGSATEASAYTGRFMQGANLVPRLLFRVEPDTQSQLGTPAGCVAVRSERTAGEKAPWKALPTHVGVVEQEFVWPTVLGEHLVPFRITGSCKFVIPVTPRGELLDPDKSRIDQWPGLANWLRRASRTWQEHSSGKLSLLEQIDHMRKLRQQVPVPTTRVVYNGSGMHLAASVLRDSRVLVEHGLYWAAVSSPDEADYLVAILNAPALTELVRPLMSYGKDERHIDTHVWKLPIPKYSADDPAHQKVVELSRILACEVAEMAFPTANFVANRRLVRGHLKSSEHGRALNDAVATLLDSLVHE